MADWYVSSTAYTAIAAFVPSAVYSIGNIVKPTAPASQARWAFRCTTAGTASTEPAWPSANNSTITTGGATFANVTGQSAYFWAAAAGDHQTLNGAVGTVRYAAGDRVFISSDHAETANGLFFGPGSTITSGYGLVQFLCVNRAGSTPPVAADLTTGATMTNSGGILFRHRVNAFYSGIAFVLTTTTNITFNDIATNIDKTAYFQNCSFYLNFAGGPCSIQGTPQKLVFDNTTLRFANTTSFVAFGNSELVWINTPSAIAGTNFPATLFVSSSGNLQNVATLRGVDLSAITGTLISGGINGGLRYLFDSCRIASGAARYSGGSTNTADIIEFVNCYDGTNFISESYQPAGTVTTELTITLTGGATDNVGTFSHKMVSGTNIDKFNNTLTGFWMDVNYATTGSSKTATVEIISSTALNNDEISLELEYLGTASSSVASFTTSLPATVLTTATAVTTSTATWNSSPATPAKQKLQVTFTPRTAGRVRGRVRLGKASATVYVDPQVTIT